MFAAVLGRFVEMATDPSESDDVRARARRAIAHVIGDVEEPADPRSKQVGSLRRPLGMHPPPLPRIEVRARQFREGVHAVRRCRLEGAN
jgi:hypothetical protein